MRQGDIHWFTFDLPDKRRPVVVVTRQSAIDFLTKVSIAPITTTLRRSPSFVPVTPEDGVREVSAINLDGIQTVDKDRLGPYIATLSARKLREVKAGIEFAFGLNRVT